MVAGVVVGALSLTALAGVWRWSSRRAERIVASRHKHGYRTSALSNSEPLGGTERLLIYGASALLWPVGVIAAGALNQPHDVHIGTIALRISLANLALITLAVCVGLPVLAGLSP